MNVTKENVDNLNALLRVVVSPEDYKAKVDNSLAKYRKQTNVPGFRQGKVPMGIIKKQYGKAVLAEELNKLVSAGLYNFIESEKLDILGNPLPKAENDVVGDWDNPGEFEFFYEIGLSPVLEIKLSGKNKYEYTKVKIDDELINKQVDDLRRRYGKLVSGEVVGERDMVLGQFVELNEEGEIKEGGVMNSATVSIEFIEKKTVKKQFIDKKVGAKFKVNPLDVARDEKDAASMLGISEEELTDINEKFQFTITEVKVMELAELNQELFDKLFGEGEVKSEAELKERVVKDLEEMFQRDSDKILARRITNDLIEKTEVALPNEFLKRWIHASQKEEIPMEDIEKDYPNYVQGLKWQLIQNNIFKVNDIKVPTNEVMEYTKGLMANQYQQYGLPAPEDKELTESATRLLANKEEGQRIYEMLMEEKLIQFFKDTVKLKEEALSYDDFVKVAQDVNA